MKKRFNRRQFLEISASATAMAALGSTPALASPTSSTTITIDGTAAGRVFDGIGGISGGGGTSRLLIDYPSRQRKEILDYLFKPNYGASLHILKCEIGSDTDTTNGSEASHMRTRTDENYNRGYEWWLMGEAKERDSSIKLYGLEWGAPGWFTPDIDPNNSFWSNDNIHYIINWMTHALSDHGLYIDYLGGHNESGYNIAWYEALRTALNNNGFANTKIVGADSTWSIGGDLSTNSAFNAIIDIVGTHYPCSYLGNYTNCGTPTTVQNLNKPLWASENGSEDYNAGAQAVARALNRGYIDGKMTCYINWSVVAAWYSTLPYAGCGLMLADEPWSGYYEVGKSIWAMAHTGQFTKPGWQYLDSACGYLGNSKSNGSYVTLKAINQTDYSVIIETLDATAPQTMSFTLTGGLSTNVVSVWSTNLASSNSQDYFVQQPNIMPNNGTFSVTLQPGYVYSLTTTTGQQKGNANPPASAPLTLPYYENFNSYATGKLAKYFSDINGAFETALAGGGRAGNVYRQVITTAPIAWVTSFDPTSLIGDPNWSNYEVKVDVLLEQAGWVEVLGCVNSSSIFINTPSVGAYHFQVSDTGAWKLYRENGSGSQTPLVSGSVLINGVPTPIGLNTWHTLELSMNHGFIKASIDEQVVAAVYDSIYPGGQAGLSAREWINAQFDNFSVTSQGSSTLSNTVTYTITNRHSGLALEIPAKSSAIAGTVAAQNLYAHALNQQWQFVSLGSGYYKIINVASGLVLDDLAGATAAGSPIGQNAWNGGLEQQWSLVPSSNGFFFLQNRQSGLVLDVPGQSTNAGISIDQYTNNGGTNQQWSIGEAGFNPNETYTITNKNSGLVLEIPGSSIVVGTATDQNTYAYTANQQWNLVPLADHGYYKLVNGKSGLVLNDHDKETSSGAGVDQSTWDGSDEQQWSLHPSNGYYTLQNRHSKLALNVVGQSTLPGAAVAQATVTTPVQDSELWSIGKVGFGASVPYKIVSVKSGLALEIPNNSTTPGATTDQNTYTGSTSQQWNVVDLGNGYYKILNAKSGQALDDLSYASAPGSAVGQWSWNGGNDQQWNLILNNNGSYTIQNRNSGLVLDVFNQSTAPGTPVDQWTNNGGANQQWNIVLA